MERTTEFDDIRPYYDEELPLVYEELLNDPDFLKVLGYVFPEMPLEEIIKGIRKTKTKREFQQNFSYRFLWDVAKKSTDGINLDISSLEDKNQAYTIMSNHRDIVLDSGFLSILLFDEGLNTVEIAIGDNLLFLPWIKKLVRVNKSFIVQRSLSMRQMLESSARLSRYMHYAIAEKKESIWIAQREGRAKDSNDRTQDSLLKMMSMGGEGNIIDRLKSLHILPLAISYEYDPCDYLKAQEFQAKRDNENYKKTFQDDQKNMETGIFGYKGRVCLRSGISINGQLEKLDRNLSKQELFTTISGIIDKEIHRNYSLYPSNYIAHDLLYNENRFIDKYSIEQKANFKDYIEKQLDKIILERKDIPYLHEKMLTMYANPLTNYLKAME